MKIYCIGLESFEKCIQAARTIFADRCIDNKETMDVILKDKTASIVAPRLSTIRNADRILYIANKRLIEE